MSVPPEVLRIKRKRTEEPVDSLYIESNDQELNSKKRTLFKDFVFRRQDQQSAYVSSPIFSVPRILATQPGDEKQARNASGNALAASGEKTSDATTGNNGASTAKEVRRRQFHLSRPSTGISMQQPGRKGPTQPTGHIAILIERPKLEQHLVRTLPGEQQQPTGAQTPRAKSDSVSHTPLKRPGAGRGPFKPTHQTVRQSSRAVDPRLQDAMLKYAVETEQANETHIAARRPVINADVPMQDGDDGEYVYDTFVRHSAQPSALGQNGALIPTDRVGYLILEEGDQEILQVCADEDQESEKDWDSEQDDENAENYYGADYPDDEVELEDEFDVDPYRYRRGGASDDEEYDLKDESWSDEEGYEDARKGNTWRHHSDSLRTPADIHNDDLIK